MLTDTQASFNRMLNENGDQDEQPHQISSAQALRDTVASIKMDLNSVFDTGHHDPATIDAVVKRIAAAMHHCMDSIESQQSHIEAVASLEFLASSTVLLRDLVNWKISPQNIFRQIRMEEFTLLGLLSPLTVATFSGVYGGHGGIRYIHVAGQPGVNGVPDHAIPVICGNSDPTIEDGVINKLTAENLVISISRFIRKGYRLVPRPQIVFREIELEEREMMLILSSTIPIIVEDVKGKEGSVFIAGQVARTTIQWIASQLEVDFDPNQPDGVFQTVRI